MSEIKETFAATHNDQVWGEEEETLENSLTLWVVHAIISILPTSR